MNTAKKIGWFLFVIIPWLVAALATQLEHPKWDPAQLQALESIGH